MYHILVFNVTVSWRMRGASPTN